MLTPRKGAFKTFTWLNLEVLACPISNCKPKPYFDFHMLCLGSRVGFPLYSSLTGQLIFLVWFLPHTKCFGENQSKFTVRLVSNILCKLLLTNCYPNTMKQKGSQVLFNGCWTQHDKWLDIFTELWFPSSKTRRHWNKSFLSSKKKIIFLS